MTSLKENDDKIFQNSVSYLHNISSMGFNPPALKCMYLTKARLMELRKNIQLPFYTTKSTVRCQRCFLNLIDGPASYKVTPEEKKSRFARRMLTKLDEDKPLTKYQRKYVKRLNQFKGNRLMITCKFCKKECLIKMAKPKKLVTAKDLKITKQKKKKTKKKDKFCGLKKDVVLSVTPQNVNKAARKVVETPVVKTIKVGSKRKSRDPSQVKKENAKRSTKEPVIVTKASIRKSQRKIKKKDKLKEFINTSSMIKASPSAKLKQFLQDQSSTAKEKAVGALADYPLLEALDLPWHK
ncbi:hypothetical protein NQ315_015820 [Exocentrus adspersus]|uniref:Uncharacterized protein n=1 Tax=Exocentrus adspersus TaxID=1586481 RepID=A0AAV8W3F9_9CUCU|nr:hypothetical protein NQ315_015820 [Exocentrus adspersus]